MPTGPGRGCGPARRASSGVDPMMRPLAVALTMGLIAIAASGATAWAEGREKAPGDVPGPLASAFRPPAESRDDLGSYKSPLVFDDGRPVRDAADWPARRQEILA